MSTVRACRNALTAILSAWRVSTAPPKLIRPWLDSARNLVNAEGPSWELSELLAVTDELEAWAEFIRANPDEYAMEAAEVRLLPLHVPLALTSLTRSTQISFNSTVAEEHFPTLNTLYDESPGTSARSEPRRRRRARRESPRPSSRTRSRSPKRVRPSLFSPLFVELD